MKKKIRINSKKKSYLIWIDRLGKEHKVHQMTDDYIVNCMNMIIRSYQPEKYTNIFSTDWLIEHGQQYLQMFSRELKSRLLYRTTTLPALTTIGRTQH